MILESTLSVKFGSLSKGTPFDKSSLDRCVMPGIIIICMSIFVGWIGGVFVSTKNRKKVSAKILKVTHSYNKIDRHPDCIVELEYAVNNVIYRQTTKKLSPSSKIGKSVSIYCSEDDPKNFIIRADTSVYIVMILIFIVGVIVFYKSMS